MFNPCSFCKAECCKTYLITVTIFDALRAAEASGRKPEEFAELHEMRLLAFDPDVVLDTTDGYGSYILCFKSYPCAFLRKDNLCSIHTASPLCCRRYPYTLEGKLNARFCGIPAAFLFAVTKPGLEKERITKESELYKKIAAEWNKSPGTMKECLKFLLRKGRPVFRALYGSKTRS